ncbi:MAG: hypothetical protein ACOYKE_11675 [Ferruginibacter sp.]
MPRKNLLSFHEAIVVALINQPTRTASFEQIAAFIIERNLCPKRDGGVLLEDQVMLRTTQSKGAYAHLFQEIGAGFIRLKDSYADFPLHLSSALEALLDYDKHFYNPDLKELSVIDKSYGAKETRKIKMSPADIICILSKEKSRNKNIYFFERGLNTIRCFQFNNQEFNFKTLCEYLDPVNNYLVQVSKSAIVNVSFFEPVKKKLLAYNDTAGITEALSTIQISEKEQGDLFLQNFTTVKGSYNRRIMLQKVTLGYKTDMER